MNIIILLQIQPFLVPRELELLSEEFIHYQLLLNDNIPKDIWEKATVVVKVDGERKFRMDVIWQL